VFVVGGDVADPGVQAQGVVAVLDEGELGLEYAGVGDLLQVRVLGLGVAEEGLDPGLVGGGAGLAVSRDWCGGWRPRTGAGR